MTLVDWEIEALVKRADASISIEPFDVKFIQPASYDVHLSRWFRYYTANYRQPIDVKSDKEQTRLEEARVFDIPPRQFILASTIERVELSGHILARLEGKSSLGRLGLIVHATAGFIDPGFKGHITLELFNMNNRPIRLYAGMPIGQLSFQKTASARKPYGQVAGSKYQDQVEAPVESQYWKNFPDKILES